MFPEELIALDRWCVWNYVERDGKETKVPINPLTGEFAKSNDESTWGSFEAALYTFKKGRADGLGFFFKAPYIGIDLDNIEDDIFRYQEGDYENNIVHEFYEAFKSYGEISPSGTGVHIIAKGTIPGERRRHRNVEMYSEGRFFTMTENSLHKYKTVNEVNEDSFKAIYDKYLKPKVTYLPNNNPGLSGHDLSDLQVISKIHNSKQSIVFDRLLKGGWEEDYSSQSEADMAMANILAFWTARNFTQMDRIFRDSSLMRDKWDEKRGKTTYGQATLQKAINETQNTYQPVTEKPTFDYKFGAEFGEETKAKKEYPPRSYDDTGNAERVLDRYGDIIKYSYTSKRFYIYDGTVWLEDKIGTINKLVDATIEDMKNEKIIVSEDVDEETAAANLQKHIKNSRGNRNKKSIIEELKHNVAVLPEEFDRDSMLLNTMNGYLNLTSGEMKEHDREKLFSKKTTSEYTDNATPDTWLSFLNDIFAYDQEMIRFIQKALGYSMTGSSKEQVMFILLGNGRNGKSLFVNTIAEIMGDYSTNMQAESLMVKRGGSDINNDIARLSDARFVTSSEPNEGFVFDEGLIKQMTGDDKITARFLHQENFEFEAKFKIWLATNHKPIVRGTDDGIWRRLVVIPFDVQIPNEKVDKDLKYKLLREAPAILDWMLEGCLMWQREGLDEREWPQKIKDSAVAYRKEMDITDAFLEEMCDEGEEYEIYGSELYQTYSNWAKQASEYDVGSVEFGKRMKKKFESKRSNGIKYIGVRLKVDSRFGFIK